jgi:hypothetical protein
MDGAGDMMPIIEISIATEDLCRTAPAKALSRLDLDHDRIHLAVTESCYSQRSWRWNGVLIPKDLTDW